MAQPNVTLKQFRYLVALADFEHFRHAAEFCGVSQPSLSVQLQNLESILNTRLVERSRGGVIFTPVGREVVARARRLLFEAQAIKDYVTAASHGLAGTIRLGVNATLGPYLLPRVLAALRREHPDTKLYIRESRPTNLETELGTGLHDVILVQLPIHNADYETAPLFSEPIFLAVSANHPLAKKKHVSVKDLKGLPVLSLNPEFHLHHQVHALCEAFGAQLIRDYEGTSLDALRQMVAMDMGTTFLPALYAQSEISELGDVVTIPLKGRRISRPIGLAWRKGAGRSSGYAEMAGFIRDVVRKDFKVLALDHQDLLPPWSP
ncbi:MAG: hydrogen peroxide-inducible genes activator [Alphaproteobacteria bacterium]|nr:hydrogen peroxide-inducible genes activator [Alphaproteobacteria bacterium]